jgi:hypothetical protein
MPLVILPTSGISVTGATAANLRQPVGSLFVSGTPSGFAGPWAIETQTLTVNYVRVPTKMGLVSGTDSEVYSLSGNNTRVTEVRETGLRAVVTASYRKVKDYNSYATSAHQQPQRFSILADADKFGDTYGAGLSSTTYLLGPAGTVFTSQPYMRRVAWDDTTDEEVASSIVGANFLAVDYLGVPFEASLVDDNFNLGIYPGAAHAFVDTATAPFFLDSSWFGFGAKYALAGKYGRSKETDARFIGWMDNLSDAITNSYLYKTTFTEGVDYTINATTKEAILVPPKVGMDFYDKNVHLY